MDVGEYIRRKQRESNDAKREKERKERADSDMSATEAFNRYSFMNEEQLMQELFRIGRVSSGNVSADELDGFYRNVQSFLTPEQSARMKELISQLKRQ